VINLNELSSKDLAKLVKIREKIEALEAELTVAFNKGEKRVQKETATRALQEPLKGQPKLRAVITGILKTAGRPLSVQEVYEASLATGYVWRSKKPINALNVSIYTDRTFKKVAPRTFDLRMKR
jgi:hypothetical protein